MASFGALAVHELPLICFTVLVPASVGVSGAALALGAGGLAFAAVALALATAGMIGSVAHLAKPLRAPFSLAHWRESWLSREILAVSAYWAVTALWALAAWLGYGWLALPAQGAGVLLGAALLYVIARAYRVPAQPGWNDGWATAELCAVALGLGVPACALAACLHGEGAVPWWLALAPALAAILTCATAHGRGQRLALAEPSARAGACARAFDGLAPVRKAGLLLALFGLLAGMAAVLPVARQEAAVLWGAAVLLGLAASVCGRVAFYGLAQTARTAPRFR